MIVAVISTHFALRRAAEDYLDVVPTRQYILPKRFLAEYRVSFPRNRSHRGVFMRFGFEIRQQNPKLRNANGRTFVRRKPKYVCCIRV